MLIGPRDFLDFLLKLENAIEDEEICVDCETSGLNPWKTRAESADELIGVAVGFGADEFYLPVGHSYGKNLHETQVDTLLTVLSRARRLLNHNLQFDLHFLTNRGLKFSGETRDTMLLMQLLDENHSIGLKQCADRYLGSGSQDSKDLDSLLMLWGLAKDEMWRLPATAVEPYACTDVRLPPALVKKFSGIPKDLLDVWDMRNRCLPIVVKMERDGLHISRADLLAIRNEAYREMMSIQRELAQWIGNTSPNSPKVAGRLGIPDSKDETLARCGHKAAPLIQKFRGYHKAITSYYDVYEDHMDAADCIHSHFRMTGTETGRWSSSKPNVQAIPLWDEEQRVKELLTPRRPGYVMAELDYSQAEMRVVAHYTQDKALIEAIVSGKDLHQATADATGLPRQIAKTLNFSVVYGIGASKLAYELKTTEKEAFKYLQNYHGAYPGFREFARRAESIARDRGYIKMFNGRRRHFNSRDAETRKAFSNIIQGGVSQMEEQAAIDISPIVEDAGGLLVNQVHDAFYVEVPEQTADEVLNACRGIMEAQPWCSVPMKVDVKKGPNMHSMIKVERNR